MTVLKIIIGLGVLAGLLLFSRAKSRFHKVIFLLLATCLLLGYFTDLPVKSAVFMVFGSTVLVFTSWSAYRKKWIELLLGAFTFLSFLWIFFGYPHYNLLQFSMIIPLLGYGDTLVKWQKYKDVLAVLTVLATYQVSELLRLLMAW